jgi:hypothetical protein
MPWLTSRISGATILLALLALAGCTKPLIAEKSPLAPAHMSPDSCVLDVFFVRVPLGDSRANDELWKDLDEQQIPAELRGRLMRNGFRAGVAEGQVPVVLSNLLELGDKPAPSGEVKGTSLGDLAEKPRVMRQHMQIKSGRPGEIIASTVYDQLPVLICEQDGLSGEIYNQAQAVFSVKTHPLPDGRVRIEMAPELQHDQPRQSRIEDQGVMRFDFHRPTRVFENMVISTTLSPGGMLIMTSLPSRSGSLGHHFFTEKEGGVEQKLLVVRLSQTQQDGLFATPDQLPLE